MRVRLLLPITIFAFLSGFFAFETLARSYRTENVFLVTIDGLRWQELFGGADPALIEEPQFVKDPESLKRQFWAENKEIRKSKLLPFFWSVIAKQGQIYGNRLKESYVNTANLLLFSYPGYNEILTGGNCSTHPVTGAVYTALGLKEFSCIGCAGMSQALHGSAARFDPAYRSAEGRADPCFVATGSGPGGACGRA